MNWDDLKVLLALSRAGSTRKAAAMLAVSNTTVMRRLESLEEQVGGRLFDRCLLYTSPSPRDAHESRMPSSA